jgi:hypothetical protein
MVLFYFLVCVCIHLFMQFDFLCGLLIFYNAISNSQVRFYQSLSIVGEVIHGKRKFLNHAKIFPSDRRVPIE